jgi:hypothetical protein
MKYRTAQLLAPEDLGDAGTKTVDINLDQPISRIDIRWKVTKGTAGMDAPGPADISRIELVDGSTVLHSLTGYENQALAYYSYPGILMGHGQHLTGNSQVELFRISFGRHLWDPDLAFLPGNFRNPQLKITWDEDVSDSEVSTNEMEILAHIFDEKQVAPTGFLRAIEEYSYTLGADNSYETIKLSEDHVIRQMLVRAYQAAYEPWYSIDEARLDENNMQRIPWEYTNLENYYRRMKSVWPLISYPFQSTASAAGVITYVPTTEYWGAFVGVQQSGGVVPYVNAGGARGGKLTIYAASTVQITGHIQGWLPWHCYQFPFGLQHDMEDWYDPAGKSPRLRLRASTGATSSTGQVVLEQLHRY